MILYTYNEPGYTCCMPVKSLHSEPIIKKSLYRIFLRPFFKVAFELILVYFNLLLYI